LVVLSAAWAVFLLDYWFPCLKYVPSIAIFTMQASLHNLNVRAHMCGVFGIFNSKTPAEDTFYGLYSLQHRGQEAAGIVVAEYNKAKKKTLFRQHKDMPQSATIDTQPQALPSQQTTSSPFL